MLTVQTTETVWADRVPSSLTRQSFDALLDNEIPYIRIKNFAQADVCENLVRLAASEGFSAYRDVEPQINRIGNTVFEYNHISKAEYFRKNVEMRATQSRIFSGSFDPVTQFMNILRVTTKYPVQIASNDDGEPYYAGLVRRIENGTLIHVDFSPAEQPGWEVGRVRHQLAWNLYLRTTPGDGGKTHVFNRQWAPPDDQHRQGSYGYNHCVVQGADEAVFEPELGEIVIFNTRNFHFVEETHGERVTVTSAIGMLPNNELILWS
ncbi:MAG: 2OG-Fe(II)-dependent halogenase WelO5 family protein [Thiomonas delicata]